MQCQHGVYVERRRQNQPTERHTDQHVRYTNLSTNGTVPTQLKSTVPTAGGIIMRSCLRLHATERGVTDCKLLLFNS